MKSESINRLVWLTACLIAGVTFVVYLATGTAVGGVGAPVMPLDDVYIHFQYARQLASGQPYVYNPGLPPTSGATSLIYPFVLASGYLIGFQGLNLGIWAMIVGALAFAVSILLVYHIGRVYAGDVLAALAALAFGLSGAFAWHAMSGMETPLAVCFSLALLYGLTTRRLGWLIGGGALLAITRPEGAVGAGLAALVIVGSAVAERKSDAPPATFPWRRLALALIPLLAIGLQPLLNLLITGSATASGSQAKSLLSAALSMSDILARIIDNFVGMFRAWLLPQGELVYLNLIVSGLAVLGVLSTGYSVLRNVNVATSASRIQRVANRLLTILLSPPALIVLWLIGGALLISTLDTAFWHFRRYQIPFMALLLPLAAWGAGWIGRGFRRADNGRAEAPGRQEWRPYTIGTAALLIVGAGLAAISWLPWLSYDALNVGYVRAQPLAMAQWLAANTPEDAVIAVHDVGMMRYVGGRTTLDIVGLTTPGAAAYWRQGPGAVGEFLARERPDYIANYGEGHGLGLGFLAQTDLYAEPLAEFTVDLDPRFNVALAAARQGIYRPQWWLSNAAQNIQSTVMREYVDQNDPNFRSIRQPMSFDEVVLSDSVDVANIDSEHSHNYQWTNQRPVSGFPSEFYSFATIGCVPLNEIIPCRATDGGRRLNGNESFEMSVRPNLDAILITRLHPGHPGTLDIYVNDQWLGTRVVPFLPGGWLEVPTLIPHDLITSERVSIRIVPHLDSGDYMPYFHWLYQGVYHYAGNINGSLPLAVFQNENIRLRGIGIEVQDRRANFDFHWQTNGAAQGDYVGFVHIYGTSESPVAQTDQRAGYGAVPPGNWLPGFFEDTLMINLADVPPGRYEVAIGLYDPVTFERLMPTLTDAAPPAYRVTDDGRLFIGTIEVEDTSS